MAIYTVGMSGADLVTALNVRGVFNVLSYGAIGDDSTDNTTVLQAVIDLATVNGGTVYIPGGTYKTRKLTVPIDVAIIGDGFSSVLKSIAAESLIETLLDTYIGGARIQNLTLHGNNVGTVGFNTRMISGFNIQNVNFRNFTTYGIDLCGSLVGIFINCGFVSNPISVYAHNNPSPLSAPNLITFERCTFHTCSTYGVKAEAGTLLKFEGCNFEWCGTTSNDNTGCIYYKNAAGGETSETNLGLVLNGCWFEANKGIGINLVEPTSRIAQLSVLNNTTFMDYLTLTSSDIKITGVSTVNRLLLNGCCLQNNTSLVIDGANASVVNNQSIVDGTITKTNNGKYYTTDITEVV